MIKYERTKNSLKVFYENEGRKTPILSAMQFKENNFTHLLIMVNDENGYMIDAFSSILSFEWELNSIQRGIEKIIGKEETDIVLETFRFYLMENKNKETIEKYTTSINETNSLLNFNFIIQHPELGKCVPCVWFYDGKPNFGYYACETEVIHRVLISGKSDIIASVAFIDNLYCEILYYAHKDLQKDLINSLYQICENYHEIYNYIYGDSKEISIEDLPII